MMKKNKSIIDLLVGILRNAASSLKEIIDEEIKVMDSFYMQYS